MNMNQIGPKSSNLFLHLKCRLERVDAPQGGDPCIFGPNNRMIIFLPNFDILAHVPQKVTLRVNDVILTARLLIAVARTPLTLEACTLKRSIGLIKVRI